MADIPLDIPGGWDIFLPQVMSIIRTLLKVAGGFGLAWAGLVSDSQIELLGSAALIVAGIVWSWHQKNQARRAIHTAAANDPGMTPPKLPL